MAAKEAQRQSKVVEERSPKSETLTSFMGSAILQLQQNALPLLAFLTAIFVFYFPALSGGFIWDDLLFSEEKLIRDWSGLWDIWFAPYKILEEGHYWPITYTSFWLDHKLFGLNPTGHHIVNCILYFINVVLIWRLLLKLEVPGAWAISMIFAVHPLHVESVAWLIERKSLLSALFYLGAVHLWLRFRESSSLKAYALALILYMLSLLSKSIAVTLPATLLVLLWWKQERISAQEIMRLLPFFIVGFAISLGDYLFYTTRGELGLGYSFWERVLIAVQAVWFYAGKLLWPTNLMVVYPHWDVSIDSLINWLFVAAATGVLILLWGCRHRIGKGPLAGVVFFVIALSPTLGFVDYRYMEVSFVADRYQYLAGLGLMAVLIGGAVYAIQRHLTSSGPAVMGIVAVLVIGLGSLTWRQATIYQDGVTFFSHIVAHNPTASGAYANLGDALLQQQRYDEAVIAFQKAIDMNGDSILAYGGIANSYHKLGQNNKAMEWIDRARTLNPTPLIQDKLSQLSARVLLALGKTEEAEQHLLQADQGGDSDQEIWRLLKLHQVSAKRGDIDKASIYLQRVLKLAKGDPKTLQSVADTLRSQKQYTLAIEIYKEMLAIDPNLAAAHAGMGDVLYQLERYEEAIESFGRSAELNPVPPSVTTQLIYMGLAAGELGRSADAAQYYERAVELDPRNASALEHLALFRFQEKRYEDALRLYKAASDSRPRDAQLHFNIGTILQNLERPVEAVHSYETALSLDPNIKGLRSSLKQLKRKIAEQK